MVDSTSIDEAREPLRLPAFEKAVMMSVTRALEMWRDEAMEGARPKLHMLLTPSHHYYSMRLPAFEKAVMMSVTRALEMWRDEAMEGKHLQPRLLLKALITLQ